MDAPLANCSSQIAACPSKVLSCTKQEGLRRVKEPAHRGRRKCAHSSTYELHSIVITRAEVEWSGGEVRQIVKLRKKSCSRLHGKLRSCIAAGESCLTQVSDTFKALLHASGEYLAAPDSSVVPVPGTVKADAHDGLFPLFALSKNRRQMCAMMLHSAFVRGI